MNPLISRLLFEDILDVRKQEAHEPDVDVVVSRANTIIIAMVLLLRNIVYLQLGQITIKGNVIKV